MKEIQEADSIRSVVHGTLKYTEQGLSNPHDSNLFQLFNCLL